VTDLNVSMILRLVDRLSGPLRGIRGQIGALGNAIRNADYGNLANRAGALRDAQRGAALETLGLAAGLAASLRPAIQFEAAMGEVQKVSTFKGATAFEQLGKDILDLSTRIPIAATGLAEIVAEGARAGIAAGAIGDDDMRAQLLAFARDTATVATAFDMLPAEAADAMAKMRNIFGRDQAGVTMLADAVNQLGDNMSTNEKQILDVLRRSGANAKGFGLTAEQAAALGATLLDLGTPAEVAGTGINALLLKMQTATKQGGKFQDGLDALGISAEALEKRIGEDAQGALNEFLLAISKNEKKLHVLTDLFGLEYSDDVMRLVNGLDRYRLAQGLVADETQFAGLMSQQFRERIEKTDKQLEMFKGQLFRVAVAAGTILLPALRDLLDAVTPMLEQATAWAEANPELVRTIALVSASLIGLRLGLIAITWLFAGLASVVFRVAQGIGLVGRAFLFAARFINPWVLAITTIIGLGTALYNSWQPFADWWDGVWADTLKVIDQVVSALKALLNGDMPAAWEALQKAGEGVIQLWESVTAPIRAVIDEISELILAAQRLLGLRSSLSGTVDPAFSLNPDGTRGKQFLFAPPEARASGGPVLPGRPYLVGEQGPEIVTFGAAGMVTPNHALVDRRPPLPPRESRGAPINASFTINAAPGMDPGAIARAVRDELGRLMDGNGDLHDGAMYRGTA
jgi:TP901 family phage tail tape measure protein